MATPADEPVHAAHDPDAERLLALLLAGIALVAGGHARRVVMANVPGIADVAVAGLPFARRAGVRFRLARNGSGSLRMVVGPRLR